VARPRGSGALVGGRGAQVAAGCGLAEGDPESAASPPAPQKGVRRRLVRNETPSP